MSLDKNFGRLKIFGFKLNYVLDIGAQLGIFSKNLKKTFPNCKFVLFEPNINCNYELEKGNFEYLNWLLYKSPNKRIKFYIDKSNSFSTGNSIYLEQTDYFDKKNFINLKTKTLDQFSSPDLIDLIKIDVQGAEIDVMMGGLNTLKKTKFVLVETALKNYNLNAPDEKSVINFMKKNNFKNFILFDIHVWKNANNNLANIQTGDVHHRDLLFLNSKSKFTDKFKFILLKIYINIKSFSKK